jgi:phage terminase large subunit
LETDLVVPEILVIPDKLIPIITTINDKRYFLIDGGRGGGKSQSVGRLILYLAEQKTLRIVCGRETQNSINESVYSLLTDLISKYNLNFEVLANKITHRITGTTINFRGFREQGRFNIQGMEGTDILWIDESQAITKQTRDVLIPTIRKDNAKIFFTMNRHIHNDPVYEMFIDRTDCLHIHLNYMDNPFCTNALKREAEECKLKSESDYNHIWLGMPLAQTEDSVFGHDELMSAYNNKYPLRESYGLKIGGFDIARYGDDKCACEILMQMGALHWEECFTDQWDHKDLNYTTGRILMTSNEQRIEHSIIDEDGIGAGPLDTLNKGRGLNNFVGFRNPALSYKDNQFYGNTRTLNTYKLKDMILKGHLCLTNLATIAELETLKYTFDHNQRRILISKDVMKTKFKIKSPNLADALIMAVSLIGEIKYNQDKQYYNLPTIYKETDMLKEAGIR